MAITELELILNRVNRSGPCWIWEGGTSGGRPIMYVPIRRQRLVVRATWELHYGPLDSAHVVRRTCSSSLCVNPAHMTTELRKRIGTEPPAVEKRCRDCGLTWPASEFQQKTSKVDGLESYCRSCSRERQRLYNLSRYGLTLEAYDALMERQGGVCAACGDRPTKGKGRRLHVDHDHATGTVRGLLCQACNLAIGHTGDKVERLRGLIKYLERL